MDIRYYQKDGRVGATYHLSLEEHDQVMKEDLIRFFPSKNPWYDDIDIGLVPTAIQEKGKAEIQRYVLDACRKLHKANLAKHRKIRDEYYRRMNEVNATVSVRHDGVTLVGQIVRDSEGVAVSLEKPVKSTHGYIITGGRGCPLFNHEGYLHKDRVAEAEELLVKLYKEVVNRQKHGKTVNLVESLNDEAEP